jgi:hypothetical protein
MALSSSARGVLVTGWDVLVNACGVDASVNATGLCQTLLQLVRNGTQLSADDGNPLPQHDNLFPVVDGVRMFSVVHLPYLELALVKDGLVDAPELFALGLAARSRHLLQRLRQDPDQREAAAQLAMHMTGGFARAVGLELAMQSQQTRSSKEADER